MAAKDEPVYTQFPECKYLGRIVLDGPVNARPHKMALQSMIDAIEGNAPSKNKRRLRFEIQVLRPVVPDNRADRQVKETFVAFNKQGEELFRVAFSDIVSVGSSRRTFVFITLDEHGISTPAKKSVPREGHGNFFVQAFKFPTVDDATTISQNLIRAVERARIKDMQAKIKLKRGASMNGWTAASTETDRVLIEENTGRMSFMSPLPAEVPEHLLKVTPRAEAVAAPAPVAAVPADRDDIQRTLDSHDLSPNVDTAPRAQPKRLGRRGPTQDKAAKMQQQFGTAIVQASDVTTSSPHDSPSSHGGSNHSLNIVSHDHRLHAVPLVTETGAVHRVKQESALSGAPAESGYTSDNSPMGSSVSLLSAKSTMAVDDGLTPSPLATKMSNKEGFKHATQRNLLAPPHAGKTVSIV
eukprot:m.174929 g.174929  ORF g.174929 m.174929 type:complete len:411 (+) comp13897_c0_seq1:109-1341(+)